MQQKISFRLLPSEATDDPLIKKLIASHASVKPVDVTGWHISKRSIDARGKTIYINLTINAFIKEPFYERASDAINLQDVRNAATKIIIIGAGPAGLFAALYLIEHGIKPILLERGKDVRARRRDLAALNKEGKVNPESNYCFGEGGAGTYSDGKLYTRSSKRGNVDRILNLFVHFGADEQILYEAHPHIGTNKLPQIITTMRKAIIDCGGEFLFEKKVCDLEIKNEKVIAVKTADGNNFSADAFILATGHSARDIFNLLDGKNILIEPKPFALGVRIEHPQKLINQIQYHNSSDSGSLPPASYSLVDQVLERGVFSFCMCPGGIIAPAATNENEIVVNGWSPSKRNNPYANSGIVVQVEIPDANNYLKQQKLKVNNEKLSMLYFQQHVEQNAYKYGGGKLKAPAQRLVDFVENKISSTLPQCSYLPGISSADMYAVLPDFISKSLQKGFKKFGNKMRGYYSNEAIIVGVESRTSSPVKIPRDAEGLHHPQLKNLYPCGEGAGFAGGIVSAAMDGERIAAMITDKIRK
ncbi:FAD-binding protein [soil metagenome]